MTKIPARASTSRPRQTSALPTARAPAQVVEQNKRKQHPTNAVGPPDLGQADLGQADLGQIFWRSPPYFRIRIVRHDPVPKHNVTIDRSPAMYPAVNNGLNAAYRGQSKQLPLEAKCQLCDVKRIWLVNRLLGEQIKSLPHFRCPSVAERT